LQDSLDPVSDIKVQVLFHHPVFAGSGILAAMASIDHDDCERSWRSRWQIDAGDQSGRGSQLQPDK
jgi:hypothetical protein